MSYGFPLQCDRPVTRTNDEARHKGHHKKKLASPVREKRAEFTLEREEEKILS